ncbi:MAG TPA: chemotaxis protein CheW [Blastocatellia bacterium]|nr:chemotaxis protein CheW [Blastocatellia bacterium]
MAKSNKEPNKKSGLAIGALPLELVSNEPADANPNTVSALVFIAGEKRFAIGVEHTEGVVYCPRISPLPSAPDGMIGVASVRGRMTLVIDLSLAAERNKAGMRLILIKGESQLGLLADYVESVVALEPKHLRATAPRNNPSASRRVKEPESAWPVRAYFTSNGAQVPLIDVERLAEM